MRGVEFIVPRRLDPCNFCGKSRHEVFHVIDGPECRICDECIDLCVEIIEEKKEVRYFIMINSPDGKGIVPMRENVESQDVCLFNSYRAAAHVADRHWVCEAFGYEIFRVGNGEKCAKGEAND